MISPEQPTEHWQREILFPSEHGRWTGVLSLRYLFSLWIAAASYAKLELNPFDLKGVQATISIKQIIKKNTSTELLEWKV